MEMKIMFAFILFLVGTTAFAQKKQKIELQWKIGEAEKVSYLTVMNEIDTSSVDINFNGIFKAFSDSTLQGMSKAKEFLKKLNQSFKNIDFVSTLTRKNKEIIDVVVMARPKEKGTESASDTVNQPKGLMKMMQAMNQGVMLRGSVYTTGGIHSFWMKSNQKNLLSVFFELPTSSVKIGDTWKLDVNLISNDQNFECDSSYKVNTVKLTDIKTENGERIAVLKYDIMEYVQGNFTMPSFSGDTGKKIPTSMKFTHHAIAEFLIDKGIWKSYDGLMSFDASGVMTASKKTKLTLIQL